MNDAMVFLYATTLAEMETERIEAIAMTEKELAVKVEYGTNNVIGTVDYTRKSTALNAAAKLQGLPFVDFMATYRLAKEREKR